MGGDLFLRYHHGGRVVNEENILKYVGGSVNVEGDKDPDKLSRIEILWGIRKLGYKTCGSIYMRNELSRELTVVKDDLDVLNVLNCKGSSNYVDVFVDKTENANESGPQKEDGIDSVANMCINTLPNSIVALNEGVKDNNKKGEANQEEDSDASSFEGESDSEEDENYIEPNEPSDGSDFDEELAQVRAKILSEKRDRSRRKRPEPIAEVQLGPLGTDKGVDGLEFVRRNDREGLLGGDEDYIDSSDVDSFGSNFDDEDGPQRSRGRRVHYDPHRDLPIFEVGMVFKDVYEFRDAISLYSVKRGANLKRKPNDFDKVRARCKGCTWQVYGSLDTETHDFVVRTYYPTHIYYKTNKNRHCDSKFIAKYFKDKIVDNPNIRIWRLQEMVKNKLEVYVGKSVCRRAKLKVIEELVGDYKEEFKRIYDYTDEILRSNPGSTCVVLVDTVDIPIRYVFIGFYVCFKAMKEGFKLGCRKFLGMDGCFLKGICKGELLSVTTKDANSQMYPIAWVVVDVESKDTWKWFLQLVQADLDLDAGQGYTLVTDMQKGLDAAITVVLPAVEHRMCARHILASWAKTWRGVDKRNCFWAICKSSFEAKLRDNLSELNNIGGIECVEELLNCNKTRWCRVYFPFGNKCDAIDNNISETFNSWILAARHKTIITMLEEIRIQCMVRHTQMREFAEKWRCGISPMALKTLGKNSGVAMRCRIEWNGDAGYEVVDGEYKHVVDLRKKSCSCRSWELKGIPCPHAVAAMHQQNKDPVDYVSKWYGIEKFKLAYSDFLQPGLNMKMWPTSEHPKVEPPPIRIMPGRPKKNRRKDKDEVKKIGKLSKKGSILRCSHCRQQGHNKKSCKVLKQGGPSQSTMASTSGTKPVPQRPQPHRKQRMPKHLKNKEDSTVKQQPTKKAKMTGVGICISERTGWTCAQNLRGEQTVISTGAKKLKNSAEVTGDIGFEARKLKWKGKEQIPNRPFIAKSASQPSNAPSIPLIAKSASQPSNAPSIPPIAKSASQPNVVRWMP